MKQKSPTVSSLPSTLIPLLNLKSSFPTALLLLLNKCLLCKTGCCEGSGRHNRARLVWRNVASVSKVTFLFSLFGWSLGYSKMFEPALAAEKSLDLDKILGPCPPGSVCSDILQFEQVQASLYDTLQPAVVVSCCHCSMLSVLDFLQHEKIGAALFSL